MKKIYENWNKFINEESEGSLDNWKHEDAKHYAEELTERYGEPDIVSDSMVLWEGKISEFTQTYIKDESIPHCCPEPHKDYAYSTMEIDVPEDLMEAVSKASESIIVDQLKNEVTARCADINANAITLGFVQKLVAGEIKPEDAKEEYEKHILEKMYPDWFKEKMDERCQKGYKTHPTTKTKKMYGKTYRNCVKAEEGKTRDTYDDEVVKRNKKDRDSDRKKMGLEEKRKKKKKKKKKKDDRCTRIAKRKYDVWPSAYASGAVVKCRQGKIWKDVKENDNINLNEEFETLLEQEDNQEFSQDERQKLKKIKKELDKASNTHKSQVDRISPISSKDKKLKKIEKELEGSSKMHKGQANRIKAIIDEEFGKFLDEKKKKKTDYSKEKKSGLHGWFSRAGGKGKSKGWVDCNTCRKDKKTGRKTCKSCGRKEGEKRSKYPACRPTPSDCGTKGKGKKWGKKSSKKESLDMKLTKTQLEDIIKEEFDNVRAGMKFKHGLSPTSLATIDAGGDFDENTGAPLTLDGSHKCFANRSCYQEWMRGFDSPGQHYDSLEPIIQSLRDGSFPGPMNPILDEEKYYHITDATYDDGAIAEDIEFWDDVLEEAEYQGRKVTLNKPMKGDVKKSKVYVKNAKGNVVKVNFGDKKMRIKKSNPKRRKSFRARHNCKNPGPKWKARYWSCKAW